MNSYLKMANILQIRHNKEFCHFFGLPRTMLGVFAHPDDESLLMGGTLALAHGEGVHTSLVTVTRGELGGKFSGIYGKELAMMRSHELVDAVRILSIESLHQMKFPDKGVHGAKREVRNALIDIISKNKPQLIITHDGFDLTQHRDHLATAQAVIDATTQIHPQWTYRVFFATLKPNADHVTYALDIQNHSNVKIQACNAHASQGLFRHTQLPLGVYYALNHFEYFMPYEHETKADDKRHHSDKK